MQNGGLFEGLGGVDFFCTKPSNFGLKAHMEAFAGVALTNVNRCPAFRPP
jgi:hypothetical protein